MFVASAELSARAYWGLRSCGIGFLRCIGSEARTDSRLVGAAIGCTDVLLRLPEEMEMQAAVTSPIPHLQPRLGRRHERLGSVRHWKEVVADPDLQTPTWSEMELLLGLVAAGVRRMAFEIGDFTVSTKTDGMISLLKNEADLLPEVIAGTHR